MSTVHVVEDGPADGPVVLLLHGFASSSHSWSLVVPLLADTFHVVRVDLLGHGATGGEAADAPAQAVAVTEVLERLDLTDVTAVGHSFGADVAAELAETTDRVTRLVIVAQAPDYSEANLPRAGVLMTHPRWSPRVYRAARPVFSGLAAVLARRRRAGDLHRLGVQALRDLRALDPAMFRTVLVDRRERLAARPLDAQFAAAGKPTLVLLGGRDHFYGARPAARYRAAGAQVEVIAASGHAMPVQLPQETADLIRAFVSAAASRTR